MNLEGGEEVHWVNGLWEASKNLLKNMLKLNLNQPALVPLAAKLSGVPGRASIKQLKVEEKQK